MTTATKARACEGKQRHSHRLDAVIHMARLISGGASRAALNVYQCPIRRHGEPRHWHVGHRPRGR